MKQVIYLCLLLFLRFSNLAAQIQSISSVPAFQAWEISLTLACQCFFNSGGAIYVFYLKLCCGEHLSVYRQHEMSLEFTTMVNPASITSLSLGIISLNSEQTPPIV